jgi:hypothetical protein
LTPNILILYLIPVALATWGVGWLIGRLFSGSETGKPRRWPAMLGRSFVLLIALLPIWQSIAQRTTLDRICRTDPPKLIVHEPPDSWNARHTDELTSLEFPRGKELELSRLYPPSPGWRVASAKNRRLISETGEFPVHTLPFVYIFRRESRLLDREENKTLVEIHDYFALPMTKASIVPELLFLIELTLRDLRTCNYMARDGERRPQLWMFLKLQNEFGKVVHESARER